MPWHPETETHREAIERIMSDGRWRTAREIADRIGTTAQTVGNIIRRHPDVESDVIVEDVFEDMTFHSAS